MREYNQSHYPSPIGLMRISAGKNGLLGLSISSINSSQSKAGAALISTEAPEFMIVRQLIKELDAYFSGDLKQFSIAIDWEQFSDFQREVLSLSARIPYGEVWTYGELARKLGKPKAARAVGNALGSNPLLILIPCHRVIGSDRRLHGYAGGSDAKAFLLRLEGHQIEADRVYRS